MVLASALDIGGMKPPDTLLLNRQCPRKCAWGAAAVSGRLWRKMVWPIASAITGSVTLSTPDIVANPIVALAVNMKAELQEVMNMLRKLQGAIDFGNAPVAERED
ncbi:MAG: hypothetical protein CM15mP84_04470 [Cellvibrionales bacterium]|nr:MAG: hypothetical protein CM15mP84_04470 [Cellvibrionales bacterium]